MKRLGRIWSELICFDNLLGAYHKARKRKQSARSVAEFSLNLESELLSLQEELTNLTYRPGHYRLFTVYERKKRQIAAAPFRDRVVHHAVMNIIEAPIDRRFIFDSYACRQGKGVLHDIRESIRERLAEDRLRLHPHKAHIYHTVRGIDLFGYQVFPHKRKLRNDNGHAFHRRLRQMARLYHERVLDWDDIHPRVRSWIGHAIHGETEGLRKALFAGIVFSRG